MTIAKWPLEERPREKLLIRGAKHVSDAELLAIFLRTGIQGKTALDLARELLMEMGSLKKLLNMDPPYFYQKRGVGRAKYAVIKAALELGRRYLSEPIQIGEALGNSESAKRFLSSRLRDYPHEVFACLFLDAHHRVLGFEELFHGTIHETSVYPREVVKRGLAHNAAKIILAHNHPSGNPTPSDADKEITQLLKSALGLVDIQVVDHVIIGSSASVSLAETGFI